jgi:quinoprotein dehydrogenase-associated probable ABC transporter substrate-binding protein
MSSRFLERLLAVVLLAAAFALLFGAPPAGAAEPPLRVCADPDNLPFSSRDGSGFENRIARLVADGLQRELRTFWWPQRRGFVRKTLGAGECDVILGMPRGAERIAATRPYYRSTYVLLTRQADPQALRGLDDPRLPSQRIGVPLVGDDVAATPVGHALARLGVVDHVVGYPVDGDGPAAERMVRALAAGELDAALAWGPAAGYFASRSAVPLRLQALAPTPGLALPFVFDIVMGVRQDEAGRHLRDELDRVLQRRRAEVDAILAEHGVPLLGRADAGDGP